MSQSSHSSTPAAGRAPYGWFPTAGSLASRPEDEQSAWPHATLSGEAGAQATGRHPTPLVRARHQSRAPRSGEPGTMKGVQLVVEDLDAVRMALVGRGVEVSHAQQLGPEVPRARGSRSSRTPDGNGWAIQELKRASLRSTSSARTYARLAQRCSSRCQPRQRPHGWSTAGVGGNDRLQRKEQPVGPNDHADPGGGPGRTPMGQRPRRFPNAGSSYA
jgi:hypothetical protein